MFWIGLGVTVVGGLLGVQLWRRWTQSRLHLGTDRVFDIATIALIVIGAVIAATDFWQSEHEKQALQKDIAQTRQEVAESRQKQAAAEQALREVEAQQRARMLTQEQRRALIQRLQAGPKGRVEISINTGDAEAQRFAAQFYEVLTVAGWPRPVFGQTTLIGGSLPIGLRVRPSQERSERLAGKNAALPLHGELLLQALRDVGLEVSLDPRYYEGPAEIVHLFVGAKPQPR